MNMVEIKSFLLIIYLIIKPNESRACIIEEFF